MILILNQDQRSFFNPNVPFLGSKFQNGQKVDFELLKLTSALLRRELLKYKVNTIMITSLNIILLTAAELPKRKKLSKIK
jgi:hypothetical protein